ncbi:hypothetical protein ES705_22528 [subsurface metagenome]
MPKLIPVLYKNKQYPNGITPKIQEIAAHFDKTKIKLKPKLEYSLHTEYSYAKRLMENQILKDLATIKNGHKNFIPKLWVDKKWSIEFVEFIKNLVHDNPQPKIIEIHPPFTDYCTSIDDFLEVYSFFENKIKEVYENVEILLENRYGTTYSGGRFLISNTEELVELSRQIDKRDLELKIALDPPQLITGNKIELLKIVQKDISRTLESLKTIKHNIKSLHLWGKKIGKTGSFIAHQGDLNTLFSNKQKLKNMFLFQLTEVLNDNTPRYFVPEVNGKNDDLHSIVNDLLNSGFIFV